MLYFCFQLNITYSITGTVKTALQNIIYVYGVNNGSVLKVVTKLY